MAEIRIFYREENRLKMSKDIEILKEVPWIIYCGST